MAGRGRRGPPGGPGRRPRGPPRGYRQQQQDYPGRVTSTTHTQFHGKVLFYEKTVVWVYTWVGGLASYGDKKKLILFNGAYKLGG
jgi:hypothetical protein